MDGWRSLFAALLCLFDSVMCLAMPRRVVESIRGTQFALSHEQRLLNQHFYIDVDFHWIRRLFHRH